MKNFYRAIFCLSICFSIKANSQVLITLWEDGGNVVAALSGSFSNINGLISTGTRGNFVVGGMRPNNPDIFINPVTATNSQIYFGYNLTGTLGSGTAFTAANSATGGDSYIGIQAGSLLLPVGETSGTFNSTATWNTHTFASLGLTDGNSLSITWDEGRESLTVNVGTVAVPEPSTYAAITSLVCMGAVIYRRRLKSKALTA